MTPTMIMFVIDALLKYGPDAARAVQKIFTTPEPTREDWESLFSVAQKKYEDYTKHPN